MFRRWLFLFFAILPISIGCGPPTLDVSDEATYRESLDRVSQELSPEDRVKLDLALQRLLDAKARQAAALGVKAEPYMLANEFRGWTAAQIIAQAETLQKHQNATSQTEGNAPAVKSTAEPALMPSQ